MPPSGSWIPKRKGRPRRKGGQNDQQMHSTTNDGLNVKDSSEPDMSTNEIQQSHSTISTTVYDKLREERPYKDFYPDLKITQTLTIIRQTKNSYSDDLPPPPPLMNDTTIMTGLSTIPVDTTTETPHTDTTITTTTTTKNQLFGVSDLSSNSVLDDICSTSPTILDETPTTNKGITTLSETSNTGDVLSLQQPSSPTHSSSKEEDTSQALTTTTRSAIQPTGAVDLTGLPKPSFYKVTDDADVPSRMKMATHNSTKLRRNSHKSKRKLSNEPPSDSAMDSDTEVDKDNGDYSDDGNESSGKSVGYRRPENHYIRYIEPTEQSLFDMVEYDMDEQDDAWLQMLNVERKMKKLGHVSCSFFENVIDKLEKEWFNLIKHLPKQTNSEPLLSEDSACSICDDGECENSNAIVFCDGCNLAVHQDCYGVPYIPEGQWLCRKCMVSPDKPVSCLFCPNEGGAFKQTNTNKWGHLLCALWIPEVGVSNSIYMEPIDNIEGIPKSRWKLTCYICKKRHGACIQCDNKHCFTAFHVTCARWARLCMRMKPHGAHSDSVLLKAHCDRHTPRDYRDEVDVEKCVLAAQKFLDPKAPKNQGRPSSSCTPRRRYVDELDDDMEYSDDDDSDDNNDDDNDDDGDDDKYTTRNRRHLDQSNTKKRKRDDKNSQHRSKRRQTMNTTTSQHLTPSIKAARAHQHHYSAGAPIAPDYILTRLENLKCVRQAVHLGRRCQLIASICRYWSLKRESRRGAPLLKRLHLEPWTASSTQLKQNEIEKAQRAKALFELRADLEVVRMLSEQVQKREKQKLEKLRRQKEYIEMVLFPVEYIIRPILNQLIELDKKEYFLYPVTLDVAPDYHEYIDNPMSFQDIIEKFHAHEYTTINAVEADLSLIWTNCMAYNQSDTSYYKLAQRMEEQATEFINKAKQLYKALDISQYTGTLAYGIDPEIFSYNLTHTTPTEATMETDTQLGHVDTDEQRSQKDEEITPITSKPPTVRSIQTTKRPDSLPKRTTRSSSTDVVHINLDDRPRKRKKLAPKLSSSPSTPTPVSTPLPLPPPSSPSSVPLENQNVSTPTASEETQPIMDYMQTPIVTAENHQVETIVTVPTSPSSPFEQLSSSPSSLPLSSEKQSSIPTSSEKQPSPTVSFKEQPSVSTASEKQSSPILSPELEPSVSISSEKQSSPILSPGLETSPPASPEKQSSPILSPGFETSPPASSEKQPSPILSFEEQSSTQIPSEEHPSSTLSSGQQQSLPISSKRQSPPTLLSSQQPPSPLLLPVQELPLPLSSEEQISSGQEQQQQQQQRLTAATSTKSHASVVPTNPGSSTLSHAQSNSASRSKRSSKLNDDKVVPRRRTRSSGSDGLTIPTKNGMKNRKMNKETMKLIMPDTMAKPVAYEEGSYKESTTRRAPCGYVYISSSDDDGDDDREGDDNNKVGTDRQDSNGVSSSTASSTANNIKANEIDNPHPSTADSEAKQNTNSNKTETKKHQQPKPKPAKKTKASKTPMFLDELRTTTPGETVWARVPGFPYHPAKIVDPEQQDFSKRLMANQTKEKTILVKFYQVPESHKWGWIKPTNIYKFGNEENDRLMLEDAKMGKKNKKSRFKEVFEGYEYVCLKLGLQTLEI